MKKIRTIIVALIALIALSSCNLDNSGILTDVINSIPSDNRNRHFIAFDETNGIFYYTRVDGLFKLDVDNGANEILLDDREVFIQNSADVGWMIADSDNNTRLIYVDDYATHQDYYLITIASDSNTPDIQKLTLAVESTSTELPDLSEIRIHEVVQNAATGDDPILLVKAQSESDSTSYLASATLSGTTLTLKAYTDDPLIEDYHEIRNGLIWYGNYKFQFLGKEVIFCNSAGDPISDLAGELGDNPIQAVAIDSDANRMVAVSYNDGLKFYEGDIPSADTADTQIKLKYIATIEEAYNRPFECIIMGNEGDQVIKWLNYSAGSTSKMYTLELDSTDHNSSPFDTSTGLEADAFAYYNNTLYMLTRNKGFFEIGNSDIHQL